MKRLALALFGLLAFTSAVLAQAVPTQQASTRLDAATAVAFAQGAVAAASTATITVPSGLYAYVTGVSFDTCANGTGTTVITNGNYTSTNLQSTPSWSVSFAAAANTCATPIRESYATPLKSAVPGTNVTVVSPTLGAGNQFTIRVYFYLAP